MLENAVRLAALAIETGSEYSDLVRRSEADPLTNARNRFAFDRALDIAIKNEKVLGARFGLIYIDLDGFKQVNDQLGHHIGDRYREETVSRLQNQLRPHGILARIGGDEFAVLITNLSSRTEAQEITARLESGFNEPFYFENAELPAAASFGCAVSPQRRNHARGRLECADPRMYKAKRQKRRGPSRFPVVTGTDSLHIGPRDRSTTFIVFCPLKPQPICLSGKPASLFPKQHALTC